jgi:hypothetical protein
LLETDSVCALLVLLPDACPSGITGQPIAAAPPFVSIRIHFGMITCPSQKRDVQQAKALLKSLENLP